MLLVDALREDFVEFPDDAAELKIDKRMRIKAKNYLDKSKSVY